MKEKEERKLIRFDWAMKRLLRNKSNFAILEGFLTVLFERKIKIQRILESESNRETPFDKANRVDILAEDTDGELILIEIQNNSEYAYFQRMLFGTSKLVTEYIERGQGYEKIRKIYAVNIVYFPLGVGNDVLYIGRTEFKGVHTGDVLDISPFQRQRFKASTAADLFPKYYILKVNDFDRVATTPLEEWISFLKNNEIPSTATAPGLPEARELLLLDKLPKAEVDSYYKHLNDLHTLKYDKEASREEGLMEGMEIGKEIGLAEGKEMGLVAGKEMGLAEGLEKGKAEGLAEGQRQKTIEIAKQALSMGMTKSDVAKLTNLTEEEIMCLLDK